MYLLLARATLDDIPLYIGINKEEVISKIKEFDENKIIDIANKVFNLDTSQITCLTLVTFENGYVVNSETVLDFEIDFPEYKN